MKTILMADGSGTILHKAAHILRHAGYEVITAGDGFAAIAEVAAHGPDLMLVDSALPNLDGYQICSLVKHNRRHRDTPMVMLAAHDGLYDRARSRVVGAVGHLYKPFSDEELLAVVEKHA